jgi:hypothetical protein
MQLGAQSVAFLTRLDVPFWMKVQPASLPPATTGIGLSSIRPVPGAARHLRGEGAGPLAWPLGEVVIYVTSALAKTCVAVMI